MIILLQIVLIVAMFIPIRWLAWKITEEWGVPEMINYRPFNCKLCLTFWLLIGCYITIWLSFSCLYTGIGGIILSVLNALAMWIDQKNKTIIV